MAEEFGRKSSLRETWLIDMTQILDEQDNEHNSHSVNATLKRHEAINTDVNARVSICMYVFKVIYCFTVCTIREFSSRVMTIVMYYCIVQKFDGGKL